MFDRQKKTALVTGASSGMGKEIAKRLIRDGFQVYVAARQIDRMEDLAALGARQLRMDISKDEDIGAAVASILAEVDGVDVLVNNAGFGLYGPVEEIGIDEARYQFEVNVFGPARLTQLLLPAMRSRQAGTIVNITSMGGKIYTRRLVSCDKTRAGRLVGFAAARACPLRHQGRGHRARPDRDGLRRCRRGWAFEAIGDRRLCESEPGGGENDESELRPRSGQRSARHRRCGVDGRQVGQAADALRRRQICKNDDRCQEVARRSHVRPPHPEPDPVNGRRKAG